MEVRHPRRPLWPMLVIAAVLLALVLAAFVIAGFPLITPGESPEPAAATPASLASGAAADGPAGEQPAGLPEPSEFAWASALWIPPPAGVGMPQGFVVQGGTLADPEPAYTAAAPLAISDAAPDAGRTPVLAAPVAGGAFYVADDGDRSEVRRLSGDGSEEVVAELEEIVWAIAVEHDASHAYLLLVDRAQRLDTGVARLALDGSGTTELVLGPSAASGGGEAVGGIRPAAIAGLRASLMLSADDRHLLRWICGPAGQLCALDALDLESGEERGFPNLAATVEVLGIANEMVFWLRCDKLGCRIGTTHVSSGEEMMVAESFGIAMLAVSEGAPVVVQTAGAGPSHALTATDPTDGETRVLIEAPGMLQLHSNPIDAQLKIVAPSGWIVANFFGNDGSQELISVRIADGETVVLPPVPLVVPPMPGVDG